MRRELTSKLGAVSLAALLLAVPQLATAQEADVTPLNADIGFIFTTFMFLVSGFLVFFMAAGFAMLEAGLVRGKNVAMQLTKNMALFSLASLFFYILGYNLMYPGDGWTIQNVLGAFSVTALEPVGLEGVEADLTYASVGSDFFFQLMFCAATASIVSGALAERIKLWPFLVFVIVLVSRDLSCSSQLEMGRWVLGRNGLSRFRRLDSGTLRRRLGSLDRCDYPRPTFGQIQRRQSEPDARLESRIGHLGNIYPLARLVRL